MLDEKKRNAMVNRRRTFRPVRRKPIEGLGKIPRFLLHLILNVFGRLVQVEGIERLETVALPVIFAMNHNNYFETIFLPCLFMYLTGRKVSFLIHWMWKDVPMIGRLMRFIDPVWVWSRPVRFAFSRRRKTRKGDDAVTNALKRLRVGISLGIFPEAKRNHDPCHLLKGRHGLAHIALRSGVDVVPVGIDFPARRLRGKIPALGKTVVRIGETLDIAIEKKAWQEMKSIKEMNATERREKEREIVRRVTDKAMTAISRLCGKMICRPHLRS